MSVLSLDLRQRIIDLHAEGESFRAIADQLRIDKNSVTNIVQLHRETGGLAPRAHGGGRPHAIDAYGRELLRRWLWMRPDRTRQELADLYNELRGTAVAEATVRAHVTALGFTRKKSRPTRASSTGPTSSPSARRSRPRRATSRPTR